MHFSHRSSTPLSLPRPEFAPPCVMGLPHIFDRVCTIESSMSTFYERSSTRWVNSQLFLTFSYKATKVEKGHMAEDDRLEFGDVQQINHSRHVDIALCSRFRTKKSSVWLCRGGMASQSDFYTTSPPSLILIVCIGSPKAMSRVLLFELIVCRSGLRRSDLTEATVTSIRRLTATTTTH